MLKETLLPLVELHYTVARFSQTVENRPTTGEL